MHTQFSFERIHHGILGTVIEIDQHNTCKKFDFYALTQIGKDIVGDCSRKRNCSTRDFHSSCADQNFYDSMKAQVSFVNEIPNYYNFARIQPIDDNFESEHETTCRFHSYIVGPPNFL